MKLENRFTVPVPVAQAWEVLLDVERIAPCMPGATLTSRDGDSFEGKVKVKVGPINLTYGGTARFVSLDEQAHVAVIEGSGKETRGTGTAKATITCRLVGTGDSTEVEVDTDLAVTGKPAQFGRGVLADVSGKLVDQFAACLSEEIRAGTPTEAAAPAAGAAAGSTPATGTVPTSGGVGTVPAGGTPAPAVTGAATTTSTGASTTSAPPRAPRTPAEPIDLLGTAGAPVAKRLAPVALALLVLVLLVRRLRR